MIVLEKGPKLSRTIDYLTLQVLPPEDSEARELILSRSLFEVVDNVLYRVQPDKTLRIIPPLKTGKSCSMRLTGVFLEDTSEMPKYTVNWPSGCITCASRRIGQREKPPLTPIPVAGPFDKVGVDILQLPK